MDLAGKLQLRGGALAVHGRPDGVELPGVDVDPSAQAVLAFVVASADLDGVAAPAFAAAREDRLAWVAYPKGGRLGTDLDRDRLATAAGERGARPVRQVALDDVWSALRFRPA